MKSVYRGSMTLAANVDMRYSNARGEQGFVFRHMDVLEFRKQQVALGAVRRECHPPGAMQEEFGREAFGFHPDTFSLPSVSLLTCSRGGLAKLKLKKIKKYLNVKTL